MRKFNREYKNLTEAHITAQTRIFYPRGLKLSKEFRDAFKAEFIRLKQETKKSDKQVYTMLCKALRFHI
jgi:hypothetical protein